MKTYIEFLEAQLEHAQKEYKDAMLIFAAIAKKYGPLVLTEKEAVEINEKSFLFWTSDEDNGTVTYTYKE